MRPARAARTILAAGAALLPAACVTGSYQRVSLYEPVAAAALARLQPGKDDLGTCLSALGAPVRVFEYKVGADRSAGMALLWFWQDTAGWGIRVSQPITERASVSFDYDQRGTDLPGCVLWFGPDLVLERWREGLVGDLLPGRTRPSPAVGG